MRCNIIPVLFRVSVNNRSALVRAAFDPLLSFSMTRFVYIFLELFVPGVGVAG